MAAQNGGYIVIDFSPIWKDTDAIGLEEGNECSDYAVLDEYARIFSYGIISKKLIIINNLKLYYDNYINEFSGVTAYYFEDYDERGGSSGIRIPLVINGSQGRKTIYLEITVYVRSDGLLGYTIRWGE